MPYCALFRFSSLLPLLAWQRTVPHDLLTATFNPTLSGCVAPTTNLGVWNCDGHWISDGGWGIWCEDWDVDKSMGCESLPYVSYNIFLSLLVVWKGIPSVQTWTVVFL